MLGSIIGAAIGSAAVNAAANRSNNNASAGYNNNAGAGQTRTVHYYDTCPNCGAAGEGTKFCSYCGTPMTYED